MTRPSKAIAALIAALALCGPGCGKKAVRTSGTVTLDGQPVEGATVLFTPLAEGAPTARGVTGPGGAFELTTSKEKDGALPGEYKVTVTYTEPVELSSAVGGVDAMKAGMQMREKAARRPPKYIIPPAYSNPATTPLTQKVPAAGPVTVEIKSR
jgi:hypothetical protein